MKKSTKISMIAGALALTTCIGAVALAGCSKPAYDPWANLTPTAYSDFKGYVDNFNMDFGVDFYGIDVSRKTSEGAYYTNYTLQLKTVDGKTYAHFNIDANIALPGGKSTQIKGDTYLLDGALFIDNGTMKYSVTYRGNIYANGSDESLEEYQLLSKYLYHAIDDVRNAEAPYSSVKTLNTVKSRLENSVIYKNEHDSSIYFMVDYQDAVTVSDGLKTTNEIFKLEFSKQAIQSFEIVTNVTTKSESTETKSTKDLQYKRFTGTINLPSDQKNWPYIVS